jgi:HD-like signal output (HDOD) protein
MSSSTAFASQNVAAVAAQLSAEISSGRMALPVLPNVAAEVLSSSLDDQSDAARLAELIQQDQSLAAHVLRVVNSPAFRGANEIVALQQAIARLGMERIREIALSASIKGILFNGGRYEALADDAWQVSLASGLWSKEVARSVKKNVEVAYLCGLLHNIGVPLLLHRLGELAPDLTTSDVISILADQTSTAGAALAMEWRLPETVAAAIRHLNDPEAAGTHVDSVAVAACGAALGRWMCDRSLLLADVLELPAVAYLNLYREDVEKLLENQDDIRISMESMVL